MGTGLVSVVIATRDRPQLVRRAIDTVCAQDYSGPIEIIIVFDQSEPEPDMVREGEERSVRVIRNTRKPGLAGARNSGIEESRGEFVAFCDDDDWWKPEKVRRQVDAARAVGKPHMVTCSIEVDFDGKRSVRLAGTDRITQAHLTRSRMSMLHSSTFMFDRTALVGPIGLINEQIPGSQNEDWDVLLRAAAIGPIVHVDEPLVVVVWGAASFFSRTWDTKVSSLYWMLDHHPVIGRDRKGVGRVYGQIAFGEASRPDRREAMRLAGRALRKDPLQWRALVSVAVANHLVSPARVLNTLHRFGRGV